MNFIPLHIYSGYSLLNSGLNFDRVFDGVQTNKYIGCGLCDKNVLSGVPEFISRCEKNNIKPIIGIDVPVNINNTLFTISLFALDEQGYLSLVKISSSLTSTLDLNLMKNELKNVVCIIASISNPFDILQNDLHELMRFSNLFKDFYIGIENYSNKDFEKVSEIREFAVSHSYNTIAFPFIKYLKPSDAIVLEITHAIANDLNIEAKELNGPYFFPSLDYIQSFYTNEEIENTEKLINKVNFNFNQKRGQMIKFSNDDAKTLLSTKCFNNLKELKINDEKHIQRLNYELEVISSMGYCDYFLIVADYVEYAKTHNIFVGPGRGSAAGALVSYLLNITTVDPLKYDLVFERFLNKDRISMPDIDIDFEDINRDKIVAYLVSRYGAERVANIITFQTIGAKQSIRDIGRVYQYPSKIIEELSKAIPDNKINLHDAYRRAPAFKALVDKDVYYLDYIKLASKIEGLPRQSSIHAAGVVLNNEPIAYKMPVINNSNTLSIAQYEMTYLENQGFLKMDVLGLRNLTIIHKCLNLIKEYRNIDIDYENIPYDIPEIYQMISKGLTSGIFQLESNGIKRAIEKLQPSCFDDIVALLALFRPGPMDSIELYARRKNKGEQVKYIVPEMEPILKSTYGIMVYQEQIMQVVQTVAGFTLSQADIFRRAISKKDIKKMSSLKEQFIKGCLNNKYSEKQANEIYNQIEKFADYGFNKSHSVCYSIITCQMAYLKVKYPYEFFISLLEVGSSSSDTKFQEYISEMKKMGINIYLPDINHSTFEYSIHNNGLLIPLTSIHGVPNPIIEAIIHERNKNGDFEDLTDFAVRLIPFGINDLQIIRLIDAGCFDSINPSRASLRHNLPSIIRFVQTFVGDSAQGNIFKLDIKNQPKPRFIQIDDNPLENFELEYEALGITVSKTILSYKKDILESKNIKTITYLKENNYPSVSFACILKDKKVIKTKKGEPMAFLKVFDEENELEVTLFPETYSKALMLLESNKVLIIKGNYQASKDSFIADSVNSLNEEDL